MGLDRNQLYLLEVYASLVIILLVVCIPLSYMTGVVRGFAAHKKQDELNQEQSKKSDKDAVVGKRENLENAKQDTKLWDPYAATLPPYANKNVLNADGTIRYVKPPMACASHAINRFNINLMPFQKPIGQTNLYSDS